MRLLPVGERPLSTTAAACARIRVLHMTVNHRAGIFLSYRREEAGYAAGRLADRIATQVDNTRVFIDVDSVPAGEDFVEAIRRAVTDVMSFWPSSGGSGPR